MQRLPPTHSIFDGAAARKVIDDLLNGELHTPRGRWLDPLVYADRRVAFDLAADAQRRANRRARKAAQAAGSPLYGGTD